MQTSALCIPVGFIIGFFLRCGWLRFAIDLVGFVFQVVDSQDSGRARARSIAWLRGEFDRVRIGFDFRFGIVHLLLICFVSQRWYARSYPVTN